MKFFGLAFTLLLSFDVLAAAKITECTADSVRPSVIQALKSLSVSIAANRKIDYIEDSFHVSYLGKKDIKDHKLLSPRLNQNIFEVGFKTKRNSAMAFLTPAQGLCDNDPTQFCYFLYNGNVVALPDPKIVVERDSEGIIISKKCIQLSHDGMNRYILMVNLTQQQMVYDDLISYSLPTVLSFDMPLNP